MALLYIQFHNLTPYIPKDCVDATLKSLHQSSNQYAIYYTFLLTRYYDDSAKSDVIPGFCVERQKCLKTQLVVLLLKGCFQTTLKIGGYPDCYGAT